MTTILTTIDNQDYNIDLEKAQELGVLTPVLKYPKINIGSVLRKKTTGEAYLLSMVDYGPTLALISLYNGNRHTKPKCVEKFNYLSPQEQWEGLGLDLNQWELIGHISEYKKA